MKPRCKDAWGRTGGTQLDDAAKKRIWWLAGIAAVAVLVVGGIAIARGGDGDQVPVSGVQSASNTETSSASGESPLTDGGTVTQSTATTATEGAVTPPPTAGAGASGGVKSPAQSPSTNKTPATATMTVKILWWNDTESKQPKGTLISIGDARWKPDVTVTQGAGTLSGLPYGKELTLVIYPDGPLGKKVSVPVTFDAKTMKSNSDQDAIHIEIKDTTVKVLGNPVKNFEVVTAR